MSRFLRSALTKRFIGGSLLMSTFFLFRKNHTYASERREVDEKLASACENLGYKNIKSALQSGADPNMEIDGIPAILFAIHFARNVGERAILEEIDDKSESMIQKIALLCNIEILSMVKSLVEAGANINVIDRYGQTPLMGACATCNVPLIEYLLSKGADKTIRDNDGDTAFDFLMLCGIMGLFSTKIDENLLERLNPE